MAYFAEQPQITYSLKFPFSVTILDKCEAPIDLSVPRSMINDSIVQEYIVNTEPVSFTFDPFIATPEDCEINYTYQTDVSGVISDFNKRTRTFTFDYQREDLAPLEGEPVSKDYKVTIFGNLDINRETKAFASFTLRLINPCNRALNLRLPSVCPLT